MKVDCVLCREFCELKDKPTPCDTCDQPMLLPDNFFAWEVICRVSGALFDGMGGINFSVVDFVFKLYDLQGQDAFFMLDKIMVYVKAARDSKE